MRPVIGHTIFFTSEKNDIGFPAFRRGFPIMVSRFADIVLVEQFIEKLDTMLLWLRNF